MSNINKQTVQAVADLKAGYTLGHADVELIQQMALDAVTLLDELESAEKRIAELESCTVTLPPRVDSSNVPFTAHTWNCCLDAVEKCLAAAGIQVIEGE